MLRLLCLLLALLHSCFPGSVPAHHRGGARPPAHHRERAHGGGLCHCQSASQEGARARVKGKTGSRGRMQFAWRRPMASAQVSASAVAPCVACIHAIRLFTTSLLSAAVCRPLLPAGGPAQPAEALRLGGCLPQGPVRILHRGLQGLPPALLLGTSLRCRQRLSLTPQQGSLAAAWIMQLMHALRALHKGAEVHCPPASPLCRACAPSSRCWWWQAACCARRRGRTSRTCCSGRCGEAAVPSPTCTPFVACAPH